MRQKEQAHGLVVRKNGSHLLGVDVDGNDPSVGGLDEIAGVRVENQHTTCGSEPVIGGGGAIDGFKRLKRLAPQVGMQIWLQWMNANDGRLLVITRMASRLSSTTCSSRRSSPNAWLHSNRRVRYSSGVAAQCIARPSTRG